MKTDDRDPSAGSWQRDHPLTGAVDRLAGQTGHDRATVAEVLSAAHAAHLVTPPAEPALGHHITRLCMYNRVGQFFATGEHEGRVLEISGDRGALFDMFEPGRIDYVSTDPADVDVLDLPFESERFDYVLCDQVIEHVTDPQRAVDEMRRVLRPGGWLVVASAFMDPVHERADNVADYWRFTPRGLRHLVRDFDFVYQCEGWGNREALAVVLFGGPRKYLPVSEDPALQRIVATNELDVPLSVWAIVRK